MLSKVVSKQQHAVVAWTPFECLIAVPRTWEWQY